MPCRVHESEDMMRQFVLEFHTRKKRQIKEADLIAFVGHDVGFSEPHVWSKVPHATKMAE